MKIKRWLSWLIVLILVLSSISLAQTIAPKQTEAANGTYTTLVVHYQEDPAANKAWNLWVWAEGGEGQVHEFTGEDAFGKTAVINVAGSHDRLGFIIRTDAWEKDGGDRWAEVNAGVAEVWVKTGDETVYTSPPDGEYRDFPAFNEIDLTVHYFRYDGDYEGWNLWVWPENGNGHPVDFTGEDSFGKVAQVTLSGLDSVKQLGMIVRKGTDGNDWADREFGDRFITKIKEDGSVEIWLVQGEEGIYYDPNHIDQTPRIVRAAIDELNEITLSTNFPIDTSSNDHGILLNGGLEIESIRPFNEGESITNKVRIVTKQEIDITQLYTIQTRLFGGATVQIGNVVRTEEFDNRYFYDGDDLGNAYSPSQTNFRVWAPTASEAKLVTYDAWDDQEGTEYVMTRAEKGTWTHTLQGNQEGVFYTYKVKIGDEWREAVDPYVRAVAVNGDKGAVVNLDKTDPKDWNNKKNAFKSSPNPEDAIIYELHVRDLSIHPESGIEQKGKFLGLTELKTTGPDKTNTGLNHIKDLGITHVQFLPIYDYRTVDETKLDVPQFNWGYDPKNYNVPEGSYSTNPYEPTTRIKELKQMIQALHKQDLGVIMDVVYNHVYSVNESSFHQLVPGYYFRYNEDGTLANGTGVGNDTASERKMMQKFIIDSVTFWADEYKMNGFRFDLMGIHDTDTMNAVREALDEIDPSIIILGEGWDLNTPLAPERKANQKNAEDMPRIGHFNDNLRDGLKGSVFDDLDAGFVNGKPGLEMLIQHGIAGGLDYDDQIASYRDPDQVIQYAEAHDNLTLWDKLEKTNPNASLEEMKKRHKLASSIVLTSQGVSFLHAGQEFMRTKYGDHNSYQSPDEINQLDWERRAEFDDEVDYIKGLIELRKHYDSFRMTTAEDIQERLEFYDAPVNSVAYTLQEKKNRALFVVHNANAENIEVDLPFKGPWKVLVNGEEAGKKVLNVVKGRTMKVDGLSTMVLVKDGKVKGF